MTTRRTVLKLSSLALAGSAFGFSLSSGEVKKFPIVRVTTAKRKFTSVSVEEIISSVQNDIIDDELRWIFGNCFPNTLDSTVEFGERNGKPDTFVITGDIHAMWLRDSSAQVWPYLPLLSNDEKLRALIAGVIHRQSYCINIDPYANAFNKGKEGNGWMSDHTAMKPELHERKWEIDSLCYPIRLAHGYWKATGDTSVFDDKWKSAMTIVVKTFREQQRMTGAGPYSFQRDTENPYDTLPEKGFGNVTKPNGLIHSAFRPSDDACIYPMLIPSNYFAVVSLRQLSEIASVVVNNSELSKAAASLAGEVDSALKKFSVVDHPEHGKIFAYEVDGFGNAIFMDDANVPSVISLPYLGAVRTDDEIYQRTRKILLGDSNPYFFKGKCGEGIGGPHVGKDMIWPLGIITRALTSIDDDEIRLCLKMLKKTHAGTGFMHETFHKDNPLKFTRAWFAWANTLFGELVLKLHRERPTILKEVL